MLTRTAGPEKSQSISRHVRKCRICRHKDRQAIEDAYLRWRSPDFITDEFHLPHHSTIYRHARATGLAPRRRENLYTALEYIIEKSERVRPTAGALIAAVRMCAQLQGNWTEPRRTCVVIHKNAEPTSSPGHQASRLASSNSNRESEIRT
jgi:hypothetical protein